MTDLGQVERRAFRNAYDDGLWDVLVACFVAVLAVGPLLSESLGDFWSTAVFVPVWGGAFLLIRLIRRLVVTPRVGSVRIGDYRRRRLQRFTWLMLAINIIAFAGGLLVAVSPSTGLAPVIIFCLIVLALASVAAYSLDTPRLFFYGVLLAACFPIGEWLFHEGYAEHHGFPVVFGLAALVIASIGVVRFVRMLGRTRRVAGDAP
jgi:hypothetical protein